MLGHVQALLDVAAMSSIEMQGVSKSGFDGLMAPIVKVAAENLLALAEPDFEFVPEKLRRGMKAVHHRRGETRPVTDVRWIVSIRVPGATQVPGVGKS